MTKKSKQYPDKIVLINSMIEAVKVQKICLYIQRWNVPLFGTNQKIKVKNQFVTIENNNGTYIDKKERYNLNK
jgi:hypothetical protein